MRNRGEVYEEFATKPQMPEGIEISFGPQYAAIKSIGESMTEPTMWWVLAGAAIAVELLTGTFYLLMLALGMAAAAIAAHLGAGQGLQMITAAIAGGGAVVFWHLKKERGHREPEAQANRNVNLDIGEIVQIAAWNPDGSAIVHYRGAQWTAIHRTGITPTPGPHRVAELVGTRLLVDKI